MKSKSIVIRSHGGPEVIEMVEVDVPDPGPGEVRIRQRAIGLNFIDIYYRTGLYANTLPHGLGFEGAGVVDAVGANVPGLKEGDRVAYPQGPIGAYAEVRTMPAATVVKIPKAISFEQAAAVMLKGIDGSISVPADVSAAGQRDHPVSCRRGRCRLDCVPVGARARRAVDWHRELA